MFVGVGGECQPAAGSARIRASALGEVVLPGPAGGEVKRPRPGGAGQPAGNAEQSAAECAGGADGAGRESDQLVQRRRLCASAAITVQALLALNWPEGKCASAWSLRSRITSSTTA